MPSEQTDLAFNRIMLCSSVCIDNGFLPFGHTLGNHDDARPLFDAAWTSQGRAKCAVCSSVIYAVMGTLLAPKC
ncbi:hypothetical protein D3C73_1243980 [compost metagenome]